ncbi:Spindle and kinetochore-associated protein 1 [Habropoda laboriosa]|uniref:SKA complex subunit 1 n=1 Tax=Habropoda laboriosa TaxID=597456 RepID=A0A0L7RAT4_9HYME|nr:Spindle and kinetochore-associated protein 1 [Habropoda laboriosa]
MTTTYSLEEILIRKCEKLRDLETATVFIKSKGVMKDEFFEMRTVVSEMCSGIESMKQRLNEMKEENNKCRELLSLLKTLDTKILHMEQNVPFELIRDYHNTENSLLLNISSEEKLVKELQISKINNDTTKLETPIKDCKKKLFNEFEVCPMILLISIDEFNKVPKYIIGRQSLDTVNNLIDTINQILKAKYTFLSLGKAHARKQGKLNIFLNYKKQDLDICNDNEYVYFFTGEDYEKHTNTKLNKMKLNLLTVLRHCKRLREYRVKNDLRYVVLTKK